MDKASVSGAEDCGFESHLGWLFYFARVRVCGTFLAKKKKVIPGGTRTPNLLIRSQTPCPIGPQGHALGPAAGPDVRRTHPKQKIKK